MGQLDQHPLQLLQNEGYISLAGIARRLPVEPGFTTHLPGQLALHREVEGAVLLGVDQLLLELEGAGIKPERLFSQSSFQGPEGSSTSHAALGGQEAFLLLETAVKLTGDPTLAIRLGQQVGIGSYGAFGFALMSCASLREAVTAALTECEARDPSWARKWCREQLARLGR